MIDASSVTQVAVWDRASRAAGSERARILLTFETALDAAVDTWTLGRRDAACARILAALAGDRIDATVRCPGCDALLEFQTTLDALFDAPDSAEPGPFCIRHGDYELTLAPVRIADLRDLPSSPARAVEQLVCRCVRDARRHGESIDPGSLPAAVRVAVSAALAAADPRSEVLVALACECGGADAVAFDISAFLWESLDRNVAQTLADVHALASAYGWRERDILALPAFRRRRYLDFVAR